MKVLLADFCSEFFEFSVVYGYKTGLIVFQQFLDNEHGRIRTCDIRGRNPVFYPTELRAQEEVGEI